MKPFPKHILIDGADGLGKTTICHLLSRRTGYPTVKMPNMKEYIKNNSPEEFSKLFNETIVQFSDYDFILDRGFTSSMVYGKHFKREFDLSYLDPLRNVLQPKVFILTGQRSDEVQYIGQHRRSFEYFRDDEVFAPTDVQAVDKIFVDLAKQEGFTLIEVWSKSPQEIVDTIMTKINEER